jgi:hypothetical protein
MSWPTLSEPIIIAQCWCNRRGEAVRVIWRSSDGKLAPGKGLAVGVKHLPRLAAALAKAVAKATELGLISADNDDGGAQ